MEQVDLIYEVFKRLVLTKQQIKSEHGFYETDSIFENVLKEIGNKFQSNEKLVSELQVEWVQYIQKNKEKVMEMLLDILTQKIKCFSSYELKNIIGSIDRFWEFIEGKVINNQVVQKAIDEIVQQDFPELAKKIREGKVEIKINVSLK